MCETYSEYVIYSIYSTCNIPYLYSILEHVIFHIFPSWILQRCPEVLLGWDPSDFEKLTEASRRDPLLGGL